MMSAEHQNPLEEFLQLLSSPEELGTTRLYNQDPSVLATLRESCQFLYQRLERLSALHSQLQRKKVKPLSTSPELVVIDEVNDDGGGTSLFHNAETLWGQVDLLQSQSQLPSLLKKSIKHLSKAAANTARIQLLAVDIPKERSNSSSSDDDEEESKGEELEVNSEGEKERNNDRMEDDSAASDADDEPTRRMRARMKRVMDDMEQESGEGGDSLPDHEHNDDDSMLDPAVQELNDGIFDIHEMEAFADEEEAYLPDQAFGVEQLESEQGVAVLDKRSFHQRQREGDIGNGEDDEEGDDGLLYRTQFVRRRKYRDDKEVEALYQLYDEPQNDQNDDDDEIQMTALDLYGKPNPKYFRNWKGQKKSDSKNDEDNDSWNDYDFEKNENEEQVGWGNEDDGDSHDGSDVSSAEEDETVPMKKVSSKKSDSQRSSKEPVDKLTLQTKLLEQEMLAEKPWQMKGETTSTARPVNSLLQVTPDFEIATKLAPTVTVEYTESIEEIIKRRILSDDWDDVIPRELPDVGWNLKRGELPEVSQEKSKLSLGELYEREYLKKAVGYDVDAGEKESELDKAKNEMKTLFANLCSKIDALSNYHFAPRPVAEEAEVRVLTKPAIAMEEVLPLHVSDGRGAAPKEVYANKRGREGVLRSESELEPPDRKRLRATKKAARRKARKAKLADEKLITRLQPGLGLNNPYEKRKVRQELEAARAKGKLTTGQADANDGYGDSGTFFKRLQEEAEQTVRGERQDSGKQKKAQSSIASSSLKL